MTDKVETEQQESEEEVLNLFADGFDDASLAGDESDAEGAKGTEAESEDDLPEKYRGKSIKDIVEMHQNLERAYGRHNNELGELRQLTDQILKQQLEGTSTEAKPELTPDDLLENPQAAIERALSENPDIKQLKAGLEARARAEQKAAFDRSHPNAAQVISDPRFAEWIKASPMRTQLFQQADREYNYELASELLNTYAEIHGVKGEEHSSEVKNAVKNAQRNAGRVGAASKKQFFKRADLMRLRAEDPERYEKLQPQILAAYQEGRVK
jgi:hypothetical protein